MFFPFQVIPLVLGRGLTPRDAYLTIYDYAQNAGVTNEATILLDFLRASSIVGGDGVNPPTLALSLAVSNFSVPAELDGEIEDEFL